MKNKYIADTYIMMALIRDLTNVIISWELMTFFEHKIDKWRIIRIQPIYFFILVGLYLFQRSKIYLDPFCKLMIYSLSFPFSSKASPKSPSLPNNTIY